MDIISLGAENFVTFKKLELNFKEIFAEDNVLFVKGINQTNPSLGSNASGKSLLSDIVSWILFDRCVRTNRATFPLVTGKVTTGWIKLKDKEHDYKIIRSRHKSSKQVILFIDDVNKSLATPELTNRLIRSIVGVDHETFKCTNIFAQRDIYRFVNKNDRDRKEMLLAVTNLKEILNIPKIIKKQLNELHSRSTTYELKIARKETELARYEERLISKRQERDRACQTAHDRIKMIAATRSEKQSQRLKWAGVVTAQAERLAKVQRRVRRLQNELNGGELEEVENKIKKYNKNILLLKTSINAIIEDVDKARKELKEFMDNPICPTCEQILEGDAYNTAIGVFTVKIKKKDLVEEKNKDLDNYKMKLIKYEKQKEEYIESTQKIMEELEEAKDKAHSIDVKLAKYNFLLRSVERDIKNFDEEEQELKELTTTNYDADINAIEEYLIKLKESKLKYEKRINKIDLKYKILEYIKYACGPKGIVASSLPEVIANFEAYTNQYLAQMTEGQIWVQFDILGDEELKSKQEKFDILIFDKEKEKAVVYEEWSGGEKTRIEAAINLALSKIISTRFNFSIFDEDVFTGIGEEGIRYVCKILQREAVENNRKIIVISHDPYVENTFTNHITIIKKDGISSVV